jgi:hypothetical protein
MWKTPKLNLNRPNLPALHNLCCHAPENPFWLRHSALAGGPAGRQSHLDPLVGQRIRPFIAGVTGMAAHPTPVNLVTTAADHGVQALP